MTPIRPHTPSNRKLASGSLRGQLYVKFYLEFNTDIVMAVGLDLVKMSLEDLEKEVTCAVCQEHYTDPKILPCLHYYCKQCILRLALRTGNNKPFSCPECCKDTTFPEGGVEELKSAFFINRLKSMFVKHKKALSKQAHCEICTNPQALAEAFCQQCDKFACKSCMHMHSVMKALFDGHKIVSIDQLLKIKAEELVPKNQAHSKCEVHGELLKIYCFDCNKLICRDCTVKDHKDHDIEFNNVAADNKKKELMESLKPLREMEDSLSRALEEVSHTEREIEAQGDSVANTIETSFEELHTILETRKQQLLEEAGRKVREKIENLKGQEENLSIASAEVRSVIDYTEQCVRLCSDDEVMSMHTEISQRIKEEVEVHDKPGNRLEPVEEADMGVEVRCAEALQLLCQKAKITHPADYLVVNNIPSIPSMAEVNKEIKMEVVNTIKKPFKSDLNLQCQIKSLPTGSVSRPKIEVKDAGRYDISYTPSVRGRHELSISAYGQPVPGSPFTMTVYISPAQLDKPVKVWGGVTDPCDITVNTVGEIIVAEGDNNIVVFDKEGKRLRSIEHTQHQIHGVQVVAVDNEDNIYFTGWKSNKIGKSNRNCDKLQVREVQQVKGPGYIGIAVVGDEVMVIERSNEGQIMVYDRELNYVRQITGRGKTLLRWLHPDCHGNLYISDGDNIIQVLSKTGDFLCSFSRDHNGVLKIKNPWMVYVCGQYVYVADLDLRKTVVFTTEGNYVTTFGCCGGTCVNQDGVLYMCDYFNCKISCYNL